jgi:hypothetical protein
MDALREFLGQIKRQGTARGNFLGLLNVVIGRHIQRADGTLVSAGCSWRTLANWLKVVRWDRAAIRELGIDPKTLHPRERERFWFQAITRASVDSEEAIQAGNRFCEALAGAGFLVTPGPRLAPHRPDALPRRE